MPANHQEPGHVGPGEEGHPGVGVEAGLGEQGAEDRRVLDVRAERAVALIRPAGGQTGGLGHERAGPR